MTSTPEQVRIVASDVATETPDADAALAPVPRLRWRESMITLGSPFRGSHRATHAWRAWELFNRQSADLLSEAARIERALPLAMPTTCIYSKHDGVAVCSTRWGYGFNLEALYVIADRLAQPEGHWWPYSV